MSLKEFHAVFITASVLLLLGFAAWGGVQYQKTHLLSHMGAAGLSAFLAVGLAFYEVRFIKRTKA